MSGTTAMATAKVTVRAARKLLGRTMHAKEWRLAGTFEVVGQNPFKMMSLVRIPPEDPLRLEHIPTGWKIVFPLREMETDFASVPKMAQWIGKALEELHLEPRSYEKAALFHDGCYAAAFVFVVHRSRAVKVAITKRQADAILFVALECQGATVADGLSYTTAVELFGKGAWTRCREHPEGWPPMYGEEKGE